MAYFKEAADKEDEEDPLIIALKKAKEKHIRSAPPGSSLTFTMPFIDLIDNFITFVRNNLS